MNAKDNLGKFDPKSNVRIFLGYLNTSKAYRVSNKRTLVVITFDESNPSSMEKVAINNDANKALQQEEPSNVKQDVELLDEVELAEKIH